jgi:hypothetical protein
VKEHVDEKNLLVNGCDSLGWSTSAQKDENNRIRNAGKVMVEILNVPDDIPKDPRLATFRRRNEV